MLVISIQVGDYNMHRVLVNNGSSVDILYYPAFQQMGIGREQLILKTAITLSVVVGDYPQQITKDVTFLVVDCLSAYNAIIG